MLEGRKQLSLEGNFTNISLEIRRRLLIVRMASNQQTIKDKLDKERREKTIQYIAQCIYKLVSGDDVHDLETAISNLKFNCLVYTV